MLTIPQQLGYGDHGAGGTKITLYAAGEYFIAKFLGSFELGAPAQHGHSRVRLSTFMSPDGWA